MPKSLYVSAILLSLAAVPVMAEGDVAKGEKVFKKCLACHTADAETNKTGPHLKAIVDRKAATVEGYKYSADLMALGEAGTVWDDANLDKYLENPKAMAPKGKMAFPGLKKPEDRADLIAWLKTKM
ncbi:MAG: c-type cytochrome [Hyphomicrobiales bacterium]